MSGDLLSVSPESLLVLEARGILTCRTMEWRVKNFAGEMKGVEMEGLVYRFELIQKREWAGERRPLGRGIYG